MKLDIKRYSKGRNIDYLLHFTRFSNLESILNNGLYPKSRFGDLTQEIHVNDDWRLDFHLDAISTSISFPNHRMFYKYRQENPDEDWAVIVIESNVIWELDCAFCRHNAADSRISSVDIEGLKTVEAFIEMFTDIEDFESREDQCLKPQDPTDPQAEVLVFGIIPAQYFRGVVVSSKEKKQWLKDEYSEFNAYYHPLNKGVFASRSYIRKYT